MLSRTRHFVPMRTLAIRRPILAKFPLSTQLQQRFSSSSSSSSSQPQPEGSLNSKFFKTFGRPIAKVFLLAIFTYQLAYYFWVRLEQDEIKSEMRATISALEARIEQLEKAK